jgi:protoporphyrinogen oxidase
MYDELNSYAPGQAQLRVAIIGAGPAGLTAAYELQKRASTAVPEVFEESDLVGGIARTESYRGYRFDIGGHRFFTKVKEVEAMWREVCGDAFVTRPRMSRIYYRGKYYFYPLKPLNALANIGFYESVRIVASYLKWQIFPHRDEENFEQWVTNRFGGRLFFHFFKSYTEKVWGIPCTEIRADWAAQRIKNNSLRKALWNAFTGANDTASMIDQFEYPRLGPGQMWEICASKVVEQGGKIHMGRRIETVEREGNRVIAIRSVVTLDDAPVRVERHEADQFISTMDLVSLVNNMEPEAPKSVRDAANKLKYRDFLIVTLILDHADPFPDNWIYVHSPDVKVGRIQNFRAWSPDMVPDVNRSSIGMEYFCHTDDRLWHMSDRELVELASKELEKLGLAGASTVVDGTVIRQPKAYPVYDGEYHDALTVISEWVNGFENLQTVGRNGLHRYNNQDHSMLSAMYAVRNIFGAKHNLWEVNVERSYHEEFQVKRKQVA